MKPPLTHNLQRSFTAVLVMSGLLISPELRGEDDGWNMSMAFGFSLSRGNSTNMLLNVDLDAERNGPVNEFKMGATYACGETDGAVTEEHGEAKGQYNRLFTRKTYLYANCEAARDEIARLDYRFILGPGVGHYLVKKDECAISVELGASYIKEKEDSPDGMGTESDDRIALRLMQQYKWSIGEAARLWESVKYLPEFGNTDVYILSSELGIEAVINARLSLRVAVEDRYDSRPAAGAVKNDVSIRSSLVCNL